MAVRSRIRNGSYTSSMVSSVNRALILLLAHVPSLYGYPLTSSLFSSRQVSVYGSENGLHPPDDKKSPSIVLYMTISAGLVLLGGIFAGLTLALMGQDEIYLRVISQSGEEHERKNAHKVLQLLQKGKHWVLVTLLLSNVITNETLPVVLDRCLGGGWPAVVTSTAAIVIFGEIIPQSVCVRYGLQIGAAFAPFVLFLMYVLFVIAYPTALLLDWTLGEDHGTMYRKSGLKTLVTLHRTMGVERLNEDEVTIISAVLDLKEKPVKDIMTPIKNVFTMSADDVLDQAAIDRILRAGYSRIPIHVPGQPLNFVGMLLVRILISYDPEDSMPVSSFPLATLPETAPDTSCLNILNYFQEGKSHMVIVSESPGESYGAMGVLTLEDVIEELIGEEIVDESDVYVDVHRGVRRTNPLPLSKRMFSQYLQLASQQQGKNTPDSGREISPATTTTTTTGAANNNSNNHKVVNTPLGSQGVHRLNPSNLAANPLMTTNSRVKIKPGDQVDQQLRFSSGHMSAQSRSVNHSPGLSTNNKSTSDEDGGSKESLIPGTQKALAKYGSLQEQQQQEGEEQPKRKTKRRLGSRQQSIPSSKPVAALGSANYHRACSTSPASERSNGIVESVVNVHGFPKTVILEGGRRDDISSSKSSSNNSTSSSGSD